MGTPGPPSLGSFVLEQQLWQRLGRHVEDFHDRPWREFEDYLLYIQLIVREEQAQARRSSGGAAR